MPMSGAGCMNGVAMSRVVACKSRRVAMIHDSWSLQGKSSGPVDLEDVNLNV